MKRVKLFIFLFLAVVTQHIYAAPIKQLVILGDSLSDNGNFYSATFKFVPKQPYFAGRFSNGPTWAENVAATLFARYHLALAVNMAYGGATAKPSRNDITWQVNSYLKQYVKPGQTFENHLFVIWIGSNDYLPAKGKVNAETDEVIASIKKQIDTLLAHGAKHFLIIGLPDLSKTPLANLVGPLYQAKVKALSTMHNKKLFAMLENEKKAHKDIEFTAFDPNPLFAEAIKHPRKFGIKNSKDACFEGDTFMYSVLSDKSYGYIDVPINHDAIIVCRDKDDRMFWDHVHPTRVVHERIAEAVLKKLNYA